MPSILRHPLPAHTSIRRQREREQLRVLQLDSTRKDLLVESLQQQVCVRRRASHERWSFAKTLGSSSNSFRCVPRTHWQAVEAERLRSGLAAAKVHAAAAEKQSMIREDELKQQIAELRAQLTQSKDSEAHLRSQVRMRVRHVCCLCVSGMRAQHRSARTQCTHNTYETSAAARRLGEARSIMTVRMACVVGPGLFTCLFSHSCDLATRAHTQILQMQQSKLEQDRTYSIGMADLESKLAGVKVRDPPLRWRSALRLRAPLLQLMSPPVRLSA